ncbi:angiopoietin-related protein 3 [Hypomesus transpacificus]|uniref:angiopoietin-related protein 3 n=1 Tax=Hypomesus transpacificus TaxID=137520 RepID=UPI001F07C07E|nr:angiopoietin-related protein 3 [Hypomesus transpacificus]
MKLVCLLLLVSVVTAAPGVKSPGVESPTLPSQDLTPPPTEAKSRFAMLDDVRLLANGLLQLGQSLREFVHKTKAQINDIFQKLNIFDRSFYQLSVVTSEIKEEEEELKKTTSFLKANNEEIKNLSLEINQKMNSILQDRSQLQNKVGGLEEKLKGLSQSMIPAEQLNEVASLKEVIEAQERTISDLLRAVGEQHDQLNHQKSKIKTLEEKFSDTDFQETVEKTSDQDMLSSFDYLTGNSTGLDTSELPVDCSELFDRGQRNSGVYPVKPNQSEPFNVYCEMNSDGGSTVVQHRDGGVVDFDQTWERYENGFGSLERDFWLGLRKIQALASQGASILRVELEDWKEERRTMEYQITLEGPSAHYTLHLTHLSGDLPDAMATQTGMKFSTKDRVNHNEPASSCDRDHSGGWWSSPCDRTNLNGRYLWGRSKGGSLGRKGILWRPGTGTSYSLKSTKMSLRPATLAASFH